MKKPLYLIIASLVVACGSKSRQYTQTKDDSLAQYRDTLIGRFNGIDIDTLIAEPIDTTKERAFWDWYIYSKNFMIDTLIVHNQFEVDLLSEGDLDGDGLEELGCLHYIHGSGCWGNYFVLTYKNGWRFLFDSVNYHVWLGCTDTPCEIDSLVSKTAVDGLLKVQYYDIEKYTPQILDDMIDTIIHISPIPIEEIGWF